MALLSAKARAVEKFKQENKDANVSEFKAKLVAYASCQSHSSVERAGLLGDVKMRLLEPDEDLSLRGKTLAKVSVKDGSSHEMFAWNQFVGIVEVFEIFCYLLALCNWWLIFSSVPSFNIFTECLKFELQIVTYEKPFCWILIYF